MNDRKVTKETPKLKPILTEGIADTFREDIADYDNPLAGVNVQSFDYFLGKLFTHFELLGLPERQALALRSSTRQVAWDWYDNLLPNPNGLASVSMQARKNQGIEK
jgi:hypothetical protein